MSKFTMQQLLTMKGDYGTLELTAAGFGYVDRLVHADNAAPSGQALSSGVERAESEVERLRDIIADECEFRRQLGQHKYADDLWSRTVSGGLPVAPVASPAAETGKAQAEWIACRHGYMPQSGQWALMWVRNRLDHSVGRHEYGSWECEEGCDAGCWRDSQGAIYGETVTHWMPLPPPPSAPEGT